MYMFMCVVCDGIFFRSVCLHVHVRVHEHEYLHCTAISPLKGTLGIMAHE